MKILMVCLGNICRSPLAHGLLEKKLGEGYEVDSAGTGNYHVGAAPDHRSVAVAKKYGLDISGQQARQITEEDLIMYDHIYAMDRSNLKNIQNLTSDPALKSKVRLILAEDPSLGLQEVPDPYYGEDEGFEKVYQMLDQVTTTLAKEIKG